MLELPTVFPSPNAPYFRGDPFPHSSPADFAYCPPHFVNMATTPELTNYYIHGHSRNSWLVTKVMGRSFVWEARRLIDCYAIICAETSR